MTVSELGTTVMAGALMRDCYFRIPRRKLGETASFFSEDLSILAVELKRCVRSRINALSEREFDDVAKISHRNETYLLFRFMI